MNHEVDKIMSNLQIIYGNGRGKTSAAIGYGMKEAGTGKQVIVVQFLKGSDTDDYGLLQRLEPEVKILSFERTDKCYMELSDDEKAEQQTGIKNGLNYVRKVLQTGECDVLILDELLGVIDNQIISEEEIKNIITLDAEIEIIVTGRNLPTLLASSANEIYEIKTIKG